MARKLNINLAQKILSFNNYDLANNENFDVIDLHACMRFCPSPPPPFQALTARYTGTVY